MHHASLRGRSFAGVAAAALLAAALAQGPAHAATTPAASAVFPIDIEAQPLADAIRMVGRQTGMNLLFDPKVVAGRTAPALHGSMTASEAVARLINGSGLSIRSVNGAATLIQKASFSAAPAAAATPPRAPARMVLAQLTPAPAPAAAEAIAPPPEALQEVVVTASRVARTGFTAPTPTTVVNAADFERRAPNSVAEVLNELPAFRPTTSPTTNAGAGTGTGQAFVDLRGLGSVRTLTLVNGRRHVPSSTTGQVDLNLIPAILIDRTEVVTGGASAAWGSDAVAGVVNLILKNKLQGVEATAQYGVSDRGDGVNYKVGLAAGTGFQGDRGHIMIGGEFSEDQGIDGQGRADRQDWIRNRGSVTNPAFATNGLPFTIYAEDIQFANQTPGGLITGPSTAPASLRGLAFGPNGTTYRLVNGQVFGNSMIGGGNTGNNAQDQTFIRAPVRRHSILAHIDYKLTDTINAFVEVFEAQSKTDSRTVVSRDGGLTSATVPPGTPAGALIARIDNPFLPASVRSQMQAAGLGAVFIGRSDYDVTMYGIHIRNQTKRIVLGLNGELGGKGGWRWDAYYQYGKNHTLEFINGGHRVSARWREATDVVTSPTTGQPICRSTLAAPANGCVPFNIFGPDASSVAARQYVVADGVSDINYTQQVASLNLHGDLFNVIAGPVSLATGVEWRQEKVVQAVDPITAASGFDFGNALPTNGQVTVKEAYAEVVVPLARDVAFARSVDLDLAGRHTEYSTSGGVNTWKIGMTWEVESQVKLRGAVSRDIRAANLNELYVSSAAGTGAFLPIDRVRNITSPNTVLLTAVGNPNLDPEKATTLTGGVVVQPRWLPGFRASVDYYKIGIKGQVARVSGQTIIDRCGQGLSAYCAYISRNGDPANAFINGVQSPFLNLNEFNTSGVDFEAIYARPMSALFGGLPGDFVLRTILNYTQNLTTVDAFGPIETAGQFAGSTPGVPHWQGTGTVTYNLSRFSGSVQVRWIGGGNIDNQAKPGTNTSANKYTIPSTATWNLSASYTFARGIQLFGVINNVLDAHTPFPLPTGSPFFDPTGRNYRVGVRMKR